MAENTVVKIPVAIEPVAASIKNLSNLFAKFKDDKTISNSVRTNLNEGLRVASDFFAKVSKYSAGQNVSPIELKKIQKDADEAGEILRQIAIKTADAFKTNPVSSAMEADLTNAKKQLKTYEDQIKETKKQLKGDTPGKVGGLQRFETDENLRSAIAAGGGTTLNPKTVDIDKVSEAYEEADKRIRAALKSTRAEITRYNTAASKDEQDATKRATLIKEQSDLFAQGKTKEAEAMQQQIDQLAKSDRFTQESADKKAAALAREQELIAKKAALEKAGTGLNEQLKTRIDAENQLLTTTEKKIEVEQNIQKIEENRNATIAKTKSELEGIKDATSTYNSSVKAFGQELNQAIHNQKKYSESIGATQRHIDNMVTRFIGFRAIFMQLKRVINDGIKVIKDLDKAFTEMSMVTNYTTEQTWAMKNAFAEIAKQTGLTITEVTKMGVEFFRQGRSYSEVLKLTEAAGVAAQVAGISTGDSIKYLTSAVNGYNMSADQAIVVSDKFAALAATSATDYEELAIALSKVAAQAYSAGVGMDNMLGFIAKALEVTREAPENIGTAFKTIFARMQELKDFGKTVEDGMDVNRIDKALSTIGVTLTNQEGSLRNLDEVLIDVGYKWDGLTKNQKAYVATALAGTRQQTRLLAVFEDFDRTMQLVESSSDSLGASFAQQSKYYDSIAYAQANLTNAWQNFVSNVISSDLFITFNNTLADVVNSLNYASQSMGGFGTVLLVLAIPAIAMLTQILLKASLATVSQIALAKQQIAINEIELAQIKVRIAELTALNAAEGTQEFIELQLLRQKQESLITSNLENAAIIKKTFLQNLNLKTQMKALVTQTALLGVTLLYIAAIGALVIGAIALYKWFDRVNIAAKQFHETQNQLVASAYNLRKSTKEVRALKDEYEELDKKVVKTAADYERMQSIVEILQDQVGREPGDLVISTPSGGLNSSILDSWLSDQDKALNETWDKIAGGILERYGSFRDALLSNELTDTEKAQVQTLQAFYEAKQDEVVSTMQEFMNLNSEVKAVYEELAKITAQMTQKTTFGGIEFDFTKSLQEQSDAAKKMMKDLYDKSEVDPGKAFGGWIDNLNPVYNLFEGQNEFYQLLEAYQTQGENFLKKDWWDWTGSGLENKKKFAKMMDDYNNNVKVVLNESRDKVKGYIQDFQNAGLTEMGTAGEQIGFLNTLGILDDTEIIPEVGKSLRDLVAEGNPTVAAIINIKDAVENAGYSFEEIAPNIKYSAGELQNLKDTLDRMDLSENVDTTKIWVDTILYGAEVAFEKLGYQIANTAEGFKDAIVVANTFADTLDKFTMQDLSYQLQNLQSIGTNIQDINKMLSGEETFDLSKMQNYINLYPELIDSIRETGTVSQEAAEIAANAAREELKANLKTKKASLLTQIKNTELELKAVQWLMENSANLAEAKLALDKEINEASYYDYVYWSTQKLIENAKLAGDDAAVKALQPQLVTYKAMADESANLTAETAYLTAQEDSLTNKLEQLRGELLGVDLALIQADKQIDISGDSAEEAADKLDMYISKMSRIRVLADAITDLSSTLGILQAQQENLDGSDFIDNMDKQQNIIAATNILLEEQVDSYRDAQEEILNGLDPALKNTIKIIDGQLYVTEEYLKLNGDQMEAIDEIVDTYNDYSESINDNTSEMENNIQAMEEFNKQKLEIVDKVKTLVIDAIKSEYETRKELAEKSFEEEKKWLDKRKTLYEEAFDSEEYINSLKELQDERTAIIQKLATLEGTVNGTEYASILNSKNELDKEINEAIAERNQEALLELLQQEEEQLDAAQEANESYYDEKINNIEELEARAVEIINSGVDATIAYLKANNEEYRNATAEGKEMMLSEWRDMVSQAVTIMQEINSNIPDMEPFIAEIESTANALGNATIEALKLADALNKIADAQKNIGGDDGDYTTTVTTPDYEYNTSSDPNNPYGIAGFTGVRKTNTELKAYWQTQLDKYLDAYTKYKNFESTYLFERNRNKSLAKDAYANMQIYEQDALAYLNAQEQYKKYKTGGLASYTGLAMLHGTSSKPERVLSSVQTDLFDRMVSSLEVLSSPTTTNTTNDSISIGNITITTPQLNNNLDFGTAGKALATELKTAINQRGLNLNKKK